MARAHGQEPPEDGYHGDYVAELAARVVAHAPDRARAARRRAERHVPRRRLPDPARRAAGRARRDAHPFRGVVLRALAARVGRHRARVRQAPRAGPPVRGRRRHLDAHHRLRRRQGPRAGALRRRAHLLRVRHRVLRQQARARLRPVHLPARRRPPRLRRPARGDGRLRGRHPGRAAAGAHRPARQDHAERRGAEAVQARRHHGHVARADRPHRRRPAALHADPLPGRLAAHPRRRRDDEQEQRQPGLLRPVRPRPAREHPAQRRRPRRDGRRRRARPEPAGHRARGRPAARPGRVPARGGAGRRAARTAPRLALPRGHRLHVPQVLRHLPGAAAGRRGDHRPAPGPPRPRRRHPPGRSPTASALLGVLAPERM